MTTDGEPGPVDPVEGLPFVFVIGFNKAGTRTIDDFFRRNGFPSIHWDEGGLARAMVDNLAAGRRILTGYDTRFRVFSDLTAINASEVIEANSYFAELDRDYPGSYFIYNTRSLDTWVHSRLRHHGDEFTELYMQALGIATVEEMVDHWIAARFAFEALIDEYFEGTGRLLVVDIEAPEPPAQRIADFLGRPMDPAAWGWLGKSNRKRVH